MRSLFRATLSNFSSDAPQQGASTITMQVVKNDFLAGLERDGRYKLLQIHYALMLEKEMTKEEILERYLNTVFFGNNAYGFQAAAETYFGKNVDELDVGRGGVPRRPRPLAVGLRPDQPARAQPGPGSSRSSIASSTEQLITEADKAICRTTWPICPSGSKALPGRDNAPTYYTEALRDYLLNRSNILGDDRAGAAQPAVPRRPADPHHAQPATAGRRPRRRATPLPDTARASTPRSCRSTPRPVRSG